MHKFIEKFGHKNALPFWLHRSDDWSGFNLTKANIFLYVFQMEQKFRYILDLSKIFCLWLLSLAYVNRSKLSFF